MHVLRGGTLFTSEKCPGGQYSPVNNVRGDIIHSDTGTSDKAAVHDSQG